MKVFLREPLLAFLLLGASLFVFFQVLNNTGNVHSQKEVVVTEGQVKAIVSSFKKVWQRSPSEEEINGLISSHVRQEILYREALAMGLGKDDAIVRRRLSQKMDFLAEDLASMEEPEESALQAYLDEHKEKYRQPDRYTFQQVFVSPSKRGDSVYSDAQNILSKLKEESVKIENLGDSLMIGNDFVMESDYEIKRTLGEQFLTLLAGLDVGTWQGPVESGFGLHLIRIDVRINGEVPTLQDARQQVVRDWSEVRREQVKKEFYEAFRQQYTVVLPEDKKPDASNNTTSALTGVQ